MWTLGSSCFGTAEVSCLGN